jgi:membrane-associated phospholipid phosphatase
MPPAVLAVAQRDRARPATRAEAVVPLLALAFALLLPVLVITIDVFTDGPLRRLDDRLAYLPWHDSNHLLVSISAVFDRAGQRAVAGTVLIVVTAVLAIRRRSLRPLVVVGGGLLLLNVVVGGMKILIGRTRPLTGHDLLFTHDSQFPSGHAANAIVSWGLLAWVLLRYSRIRRLRATPAFAAATILSVLVCCASFYEGYHWLSDLAAGLPLGGALLAITIAWDVGTTGDRRSRIGDEIALRELIPAASYAGAPQPDRTSLTPLASSGPFPRAFGRG